MAKLLDGRELQGYIKARQLRQVRNLRQAEGIVPTLLIIKSPAATAATETYVRLKRQYAEDVLIEVLVETVEEAQMQARIERANHDAAIQGIIVQLPLVDTVLSEAACVAIAPEKDVDGLGQHGLFPSATASAIDWLLAGYNISLEDKKIAIVGNGKLVGNPLYHLWKERGYRVSVFDESSADVAGTIAQSDVVVTATGVPRLITPEMIAPGSVVVDAGTASEAGKLVGDVDPALRTRDDITITPEKGGVGPLTIALLFDHVIEACLRQVGKLA